MKTNIFVTSMRQRSLFLRRSTFRKSDICFFCNRKYATQQLKANRRELYKPQHRELLGKIQEALEIQNYEQWYSMTNKEVLAAAETINKVPEVKAMLHLYNMSLITLLVSAFQEYNWNQMLFLKLKRNTLADRETHTKMYKLLLQELKLTEDDPKLVKKAFKLTTNELAKLAGKYGLKKAFLSMMRKYYNWSVLQFFSEMHPRPELFQISKPEKGKQLADLSVQRKLFMDVAEDLKVEVEQLENFALPEIVASAKRRNSHIIISTIVRNYYNSSPRKALRSIFPERSWSEKPPRAQTNNVSDHYQLLDMIARELDIKQLDDWYKVSGKMMKECAFKLGFGKHFTSIIIRQYNGSYMVMLQKLYPDHSWDPLRFQRKPRNIAIQLPFLKQVVNVIEQKLVIRNPEEWARISSEQIRKIAKMRFIRSFGGMIDILKLVYPMLLEKPSFALLIDDLSPRKRAQQRLLKTYIKELFTPFDSNVEIIEDYLSPYYFSYSNQNVELDIYLPSYKLAVEYNGQQHYKDVPVFGAFKDYQLRDLEKKRVCEENGITLVVVPYTWDSSIEYVRQLLKGTRPDIPL